MFVSLCQDLAFAEMVNLQLKWYNAFQFAGYYAAKEKGFYKEVGLDVNILVGDPKIDSSAVVLSGKAQYGVGTTSLLIQKNQGKPVVVLGVIFQHSPYVLLAKKQGDVQSVHDLLGKKVALEPQAEEILAYLNKEGLTNSKYEAVTQRHSVRDLVSGSVDAMSAYITVEPFQLDAINFPYVMYSPRSVGIDFYGDNIFTTEEEISKYPKRVERFLEATLRGWEYAISHPEELVDIILKKYETPYNRDFLINESNQMKHLIRADLIEIGYMNAGRWRHIAETYSDLGLLPEDISLDGFLYSKVDNYKKEFIVKWGLFAFAIVSVVCAVAYNFARVAKRARESEERHRLLADNATDVIWILNLKGSFVYISPSVEQFRGYTAEEAMEQSFEESLTLESAKLAKQLFQQTVKTIEDGQNIACFKIDLEHVCKDGSTVWAEVSINSMYSNRKFVGILGVTRDVSARRKAEVELRMSEDKWKAIINTSPDGIVLTTLDGEVRQINSKVLSMFGYSKSREIIGKNMYEFLHPDYHEKAYRLLGEMVKGNYTGPSDYQVIRKDGSTFFVESNAEVLRDSTGNPVEIIIIERDITDRKRVEKELLEYRNKLEVLSITDGLTGLFNRRHFDNILQQEFSRHCRSGNELSVLMIDVDYFKAYNDTYGHAQGDICLQTIAKVMSKNVQRPTDVVARYGGEEFICILPETGHWGALSVAETIRSAVNTLNLPHEKSSVSGHVTVSIGVATSQCSFNGVAESLVKKADALLYQAKENGRDRVEYDQDYVSYIDKESESKCFVQLVWNDSFRCGESLIDSQHHSLFEKVNKMLQLSTSKCEPTKMQDFVQDLLQDISHHFIDEEKFLSKISFPMLAAHKKEHENLLSKCECIYNNSPDVNSLAINLFQFLAYDVVMSHVVISDKEYFRFVSKCVENFDSRAG